MATRNSAVTVALQSWSAIFDLSKRGSGPGDREIECAGSEPKIMKNESPYLIRAGKFASRCLGAAVLVATTGVSAQVLESHVDPAGHIVLSNVSVADLSEKSERIAESFHRTSDLTAPPSGGGASGSPEAESIMPVRAASLVALDVSSALAANVAMSSRRSSLVDSSEAARRLAQAKSERERGRRVMAGEQGRFVEGDGASLRYRLRQDRLQRTVEQAQVRWFATQR